MSRRTRELVIGSALLVAATARAADPGDAVMPVLLGTSVYSHRFNDLGYEAVDTKPANSFQLSEFFGAGG